MTLYDNKNYNVNSTVRSFALSFTTVLLAACNTASNTNPEDALGVGQQTQQQVEVAEAKPVDNTDNLRAFCPRTIIRDGTNTHRTFENGVTKDDPNALNSIAIQSTITEVVRECNYSPTNLNMRVGIKGRVINGPTGRTGTFNVPIRVAVATTSKDVLYSQLHEVPVTIPEGGSNALFSYIDSQINLPVPDKPNLVVFVGFDEGPPS